MPGFPIRTPWDHSSVDSSPRPIAASHVLHRLLVPRHPPNALSNLTTKMLASTMQFSTNTHPHPNTRHQTPRTTPPPGTQFKAGMTHRRDAPEQTTPPQQACSLRTQQDAHIQPSRTTGSLHTQPEDQAVLKPAAVARTNSPVSPPSSNPTTTNRPRGLLPPLQVEVLLRKEVIQPHLPVRLPCYDFVPIASPTFDGSLHKGWATGFGCCRLS